MCDPMNPAPSVIRSRTLSELQSSKTGSANHSKVLISPSRTGTRGSQPKASLAYLMSGHLRLRSSSGSGSKTSSLPLPKILITISAISRTLTSKGLPIRSRGLSTKWLTKPIRNACRSAPKWCLVASPHPLNAFGGLNVPLDRTQRL